LRLRREWLPKLASGEILMAFAITEEDGAGVVQSKNDPVVAGTYV